MFLESWPCRFPAMWPQVRYYTAFSFRFLVWKMDLIKAAAWLVLRIK